MMRRRITLAVAMLAGALAVPQLALAQASIAGTVRDGSGGVLPGVTVEASSPVLIERSRVVTTDGAGQYRIVDLRPGTYTVTFTLAGFSTMVREGIELTGSFAAAVNAEMRVGTLEETITVTGQAPAVDVQSTLHQNVVDRELVTALPTTRQPDMLASLVPGVVTTGAIDGTQIQRGNISVHGSSGNDTLILQNGLSLAGLVGPWASQITTNMAAVEEVAVDYAAASAEQATGGPRMNLIPREGGNNFSGTFFANFANARMQGRNLTSELRARGLRTPDSIRTNYDINPGFGGPLLQDRLWFFSAFRHLRGDNYVADMFYDRNAKNPNAWTFEPDLTRRAVNNSSSTDGRVRLTWQATARNKVGLGYHYQVSCYCPRDVSATRAPEATPKHVSPIQYEIPVDWTAPVSNRLLLEAAVMHRFERNIRAVPFDLTAPGLISVQEQSTGLVFRARETYQNNPGLTYHLRAAASYVTGSHSLKFGVTDSLGYREQNLYVNNPLSYRFNNGIPNRITMYAMPHSWTDNLDAALGLYAQDQWKLQQLTLNYGIRYDFFTNSFPEQRVGSTPLTPGRDLRFPAQDNVRWHDLTPRLGAAYDLFGTGRTALKVSVNKYLAGYAASAGNANPLDSIVRTTTRSWNDANRNFVPDCDLLRPTANGECGAMADPNFGGLQSGGVIVDPDLIRGWGKRDFNWEFSAGAQHELLNRVTLDVGFFRRVFGNFQVTDNLALSASDFDTFSITAPADSRLPNGGGHVVGSLYDLKPQRFGIPAQNIVTLARNFGDQSREWQGIDASVRARLPQQLTFQVGLSTGRATEDSCEIRQRLPETAASNPYCHTATPYLTQVKAFATYTVPRVDVLVSGTLRSLPGPQILANYTATNAVVAPSLGRPLAGGTSNVTVGLVAPGTLYGDRMNQLDLRASKVFRLGRTRMQAGIDVYNALNANTVLGVNNSFATWQRPTSIMLARFIKMSMEVNF